MSSPYDGQSTAQSVPGISGENTTNGTGVSGTSQGGYGVEALSTGGVGLHAKGQVHGSVGPVEMPGQAALLDGSVVVNGPHTVNGNAQVNSSSTETALAVTNKNGNGIVGSSSTGAGVTGLGYTGTGVSGQTDTGVGVSGKSHTNYGIEGVSDENIGVYGQSTGTLWGVFGSSDTGAGGVSGSSNSGVGVNGRSVSNWGVEGSSTSGGGVWGLSTSGVGVHAESQQNDGISAVSHSNQRSGVWGNNDSGGGAGITGSNTGSGNGVQGQSNSGAGVFGQSSSGYGVQAISTGGIGLYATGQYGTAEGSQAAVFLGSVRIDKGDLNVNGNAVVLGDITLTNADCAEEFDVAEAAEVEPGTVMVLDRQGALQPSQQAYDKKVAGVISGAGDYKPGLILDKKESSEGRMPVALVGKVYCKVDAHYAPIEMGDLLTTSPTPGHAMKADDPFKAFGAVIGKALRPLETGQGLIPILVALQ